MFETQLYGALTVYRERGAYLRRLEQFEKAKTAYDEAYNNANTDVRTLTGRSQVCSDAVEPIQAYRDAELALQLEPHNMIARNMQCRAMYTLNDFERSVVMNYRGARVRRQPPYFVEGINQGIETIQDCIGVNAGDVMLDFLPLIKKSEVVVVDENEPTKKLHVSRIPYPTAKIKYTQMQARKHVILARVLAMKYLGPMAYDKFFLLKLKDDDRLMSANVTGSIELKKIARESLRSLTERQAMLRAQKPYYSIKFGERAESKYQNKYKEEFLAREREINTQIVERSLKQIDKSLRAKRVMEVISYAERLQQLLDMKTPRNLPDKEIYIDRLYRAVGEAYLCQHRLSYRLSERGNRRRISFLMGIPVGRVKSFDSVLCNYPHKFIDVKEALNKFSVTLDMCENSTMRCWLMYEISTMLATTKNYALSKFYAKRVQREAQEILNATWWLNGLFALLRGEMQQSNVNEVRAAAEEAYEYSKNIQDTEQVQAFLRKCVEMMEEEVQVEERKIIEHRENQILNVMDKAQSVEARVLFKKISVLPPGRRFSVLPQKRDFVSLKAERRRRCQMGLTIVPGPTRALPAPKKSHLPGFQIFDI